MGYVFFPFLWAKSINIFTLENLLGLNLQFTSVNFLYEWALIFVLLVSYSQGIEKDSVFPFPGLRVLKTADCGIGS
jgi:hypothetical protein